MSAGSPVPTYETSEATIAMALPIVVDCDVCTRSVATTHTAQHSCRDDGGVPLRQVFRHECPISSSRAVLASSAASRCKVNSSRKRLRSTHENSAPKLSGFMPCFMRVLKTFLSRVRPVLWSNFFQVTTLFEHMERQDNRAPAFWISKDLSAAHEASKHLLRSLLSPRKFMAMVIRTPVSILKTPGEGRSIVFTLSNCPSRPGPFALVSFSNGSLL
mmetsp:Transcript_5900/g.24903  ORF Transcript_5900/g.24903 Transcript_5900/m.24903 type:complete len:216 (+) Transcript_5900:2791-3438(+)